MGQQQRWGARGAARAQRSAGTPAGVSRPRPRPRSARCGAAPARSPPPLPQQPPASAPEETALRPPPGPHSPSPSPRFPCGPGPRPPSACGASGSARCRQAPAAPPLGGGGGHPPPGAGTGPPSAAGPQEQLRGRGAEPGSAGSEAGAAAVTSAPRAVTPFRGGGRGGAGLAAALGCRSGSGPVPRRVSVRGAGGAAAELAVLSSPGGGGPWGVKAKGVAAVAAPRRFALCSAGGGWRGGAQPGCPSLGARVASHGRWRAASCPRGCPRQWQSPPAAPAGAWHCLPECRGLRGRLEKSYGWLGK